MPRPIEGRLRTIADLLTEMGYRVQTHLPRFVAVVPSPQPGQPGKVLLIKHRDGKLTTTWVSTESYAWERPQLTMLNATPTMTQFTSAVKQMGQAIARSMSVPKHLLTKGSKRVKEDK